MILEPSGGAVVRCQSGKYIYIALQHQKYWATTSMTSRKALIDDASPSQSEWNHISQIERWIDLVPKARKFEVASRWAAPQGDDPRVAEHAAVVRFTIAGIPCAALLIRPDRNRDDDDRDDWYTTLTDDQAESLSEILSPTLTINAYFLEWADIARNGQNIQIATTWKELIDIDLSALSTSPKAAGQCGVPRSGSARSSPPTRLNSLSHPSPEP